MKENLEKQIKILANGDGQIHHNGYLAFAAGLANDCDGYREFSNEFIRNLALTSPKELVELLKEHPTAFPYLLLLRINLQKNHTTLSNVIKSQDCQKQTIANFISEKFIALGEGLKQYVGLEKEDKNLFASLYRHTLNIKATLMQNFNETAAIQLPYVGADLKKGLNKTISLLQEVHDDICVRQYISMGYNDQSTAREIRVKLNNSLTVNQEEVQNLIKIKEDEEINNAIKTLQEVKKCLTTSQSRSLQDLIKEVRDINIFKCERDNEDFKKINSNLEEIAGKKDLGAFKKFLDDVIQFFKSLIGKDRVSETEKSIANFTHRIIADRYNKELFQKPTYSKNF